MKKKLFMLVALILIALASHYYGVHRGAKSTVNALSLQLSMKAVDQMVLNSALLLSLKNEKSEQALKIALRFVENDIKHLDNIEEMLEQLPLDEFDKNKFQLSIVEARENQQLVINL